MILMVNVMFLWQIERNLVASYSTISIFQFLYTGLYPAWRARLVGLLNFKRHIIHLRSRNYHSSDKHLLFQRDKKVEERKKLVIKFKNLSIFYKNSPNLKFLKVDINLLVAPPPPQLSVNFCQLLGTPLPPSRLTSFVNGP